MNSFIKSIKKLTKSCDCIECNAKRFQKNFKNWTSGNKNIDKLIQNTQLLAHKPNEVSNALEWIPYDRFYDIEFIAKGKVGKIYRANWIDGYIWCWDTYYQNWKRKDQNMFVILKDLNNDVALEFINNEVYNKFII